MNRIIGWVGRKLFRSETPIVEGRPKTASDETDDGVNDNYKIEASRDAVGPDQIEARRSGEEVSMPDIYADRQDVTVPDLNILDQPVPETDESTGFNPYDTGVLQKKSGPKPK